MINDAPRRRVRRNLQRTHLAPEIRFALARVAEESGYDTPSAAVREMVLLGLSYCDWSPQRMQAEYLRYAAQCAEKGIENVYAEDGVR